MSRVSSHKTEISIAVLGAAVAVFLVLWFNSMGSFKEPVPMEIKRDTVEGTVRIGGSASAIPLMKIISQGYARKNPDVGIKFLLDTHSRGAISSTYEGEADIGVLSRMLTPEEEQYKMRFLHLANDVLVFATNPTVNIYNLTSQQIRGIYSGVITSWREVGGPDHPIVILDRPEHTSPKIALRQLLFGQEMAISPEAVSLERPWQMNESIRSIPYSIGYTSLADINRENLSLNVLKINGVAPSLANVENLKYEYFRPFGFVLGAEPSKQTMQLVNFIYSDEGSRIIENSGYAPVVMTLVVATIPERSIIKQEERYRPLVQYLYRKLGSKLRIRLKHLPSYEQVVDEFMAGKVNAAFFGSFTYTLAQANVGVTAIARPETGGVSQYRGLILTRKDSGIESWEDLKGRSFAMIEATTAGEIFPKLYFKKHGVNDMEEFLGQIVYVGSHDHSILKVLNGEVDAGAAKDLILYKLAQEIPRLNQEIRILARGFPVPENALTIRKGIDIKCFNCHARRETGYLKGKGFHEDNSGTLETRLRQALLRLAESEEGRAILQGFGADRFLKTTDEDYRELYNVIEELGMDLYKY